jgi:hypothetical protein
MISVTLYGRNDAHGYNLHKRAALSLNCVAELLSGVDDEIIFVDYNTPDDLPTFIEAIYDTLTDRARRRLRVLRVRPFVHDRLFRPHTHLLALEPISRNIAIRRSNSRNRWILCTNTDMIFVPRDGVADLSTAVRHLADGHYVLPRFELPEPLWESFPRCDPAAVIRTCDELGRALHLNEITASHPANRFDNPGDFQLIPRRTLFELFGFDERMIHGWHVDSNMCRRLYLHFGSTGSLAERLKGYHCDHTRVATLVHRLDLKLENDQHEFIYQVEDPHARHQAASWGLPDESIEEIDFVDGPQARFITAVRTSLGADQGTDYHSHFNELRNYVSYQPEHVLPYLAGNLPVYPRSTRLLYVGNNPRMLELLATCVSHLGFTHRLRYLGDVMSAPPASPASSPPIAVTGGAATDDRFVHSLLGDHEVLIFDFGLDPRDLPSAKVSRITDWPRSLRYSLGAVARWLEACAEQCDTLSRSTPPPRVPEFLVINANHGNYLFDRFVSQFLVTAETPYNTRVRKGRARLGRDRLYRGSRWKEIEEGLRASFGYDVRDTTVPPISLGQTIDLTMFGNASPWKDGHWGGWESDGTWIDGHRAEILLSFDQSVETDAIAEVRVQDAARGIAAQPVRVNVRLGAEHLAHWTSDPGCGDLTYRLLLPHRLFAAERVSRLAFEIENPQSAELVARARGERKIGEDPSEPGIKIQSIAFQGIEQSVYRLGSTIDFTETGTGISYLYGCWTTPGRHGTWTVGTEATLFLYFAEPPISAVMATFFIDDVMVSDDFPRLEVEVLANGEKVDQWVLGPARSPWEQKVLLSQELVTRGRPLTISFRIPTPRTPAQLGWATDTQLQGFRLARLHLRPVQVIRMGQILEFTRGGNAGDFTDSDWYPPDELGQWAKGPRAALTLPLDERPVEAIPASFFITDCMVAEGGPTLPVKVFANGRLLADWTLGPGRSPHVRALEIPRSVMEDRQSLVIAFEFPDPRSPAALGWSDDPTPLGIRLTRACVGAREVPTNYALSAEDLSAPEPPPPEPPPPPPEPPGRRSSLRAWARSLARGAFSARSGDAPSPDRVA